MTKLTTSALIEANLSELFEEVEKLDIAIHLTKDRAEQRRLLRTRAIIESHIDRRMSA